MIKIKFLARKFSYYNFCLQSLFQSAQHFYEKRKGSGAKFASLSVHPYMWLTSGCGSGRPQYRRILRIRMRMWIRIRNTVGQSDLIAFASSTFSRHLQCHGLIFFGLTLAGITDNLLAEKATHKTGIKFLSECPLRYCTHLLRRPYCYHP